MRALCLSGRALTTGTRHERTQLQWLCCAAPLWVVVRVAECIVHV